MIGWLISAFTGDTVKALASTVAKFKDSAVESERVKASVAMKQLEAKLEADRLSQQVRLATAGFFEMRVLTFFTAFPFVAHLNLVALDTCFKLGLKVPAFPRPFDEWQGAILLSFFGIAVGGKIATGIVGAILAKRAR
ncbi:hypothetical protein PMNALOAF_2777 [Methylobacterium adhaesivum]|uniref:DUF106 domain-containing protein n=1 Tax=Methylobacterium adhaesivum TaxID=333297 RepID=A0ABT8BKR1_9HYPH|nr:hypothetical protein [Methylobacterium adhaesivum]MDN3592130.1 hypothetical protein [Methylobacterium adhaesivum]GJD31518.1 hypothetical protein PMNALOAF_2777 [Methylobacterium adhaesivum]